MAAATESKAGNDTIVERGVRLKWYLRRTAGRFAGGVSHTLFSLHLVLSDPLLLFGFRRRACFCRSSSLASVFARGRLGSMGGSSQPAHANKDNEQYGGGGGG